METIIIIVGLVLLIPLFIYLQRRSLRGRLRRIKRSRPGYSRMDFLKYFQAKGYNLDYAEAVHNEILGWIVLKDFPVMPDDNLHLLCDLRDFDDLDLIHEVCSDLGLSMPDQSVLDSLNEKYPEFSPEYLVDLLENHATNSKISDKIVH